MRTINGVEVLTELQELVAPATTAVIVIDMMNIVFQKICSNEGAELPGAGATVEQVQSVIPQIKRLLLAARGKGVLVTYAEFIQRNSLGVSLMDGPNMYCHKDAPEVIEILEDSWESKTVEEIAPQSGDIVIHKSRGSAFYHTPLDDLLRTRGIRSLVVTGVLSTGCVLFTACDAMHHGYYPVIPRECVGTYDPEDHRRAMGWMETKFPVVSMKEIVNIWTIANS